MSTLTFKQKFFLYNFYFYAFERVFPVKRDFQMVKNTHKKQAQKKKKKNQMADP